MARESIVVDGETVGAHLTIAEWSVAEEPENGPKNNQQYYPPRSSLHTPQRTRVTEILIDLYQPDAMGLSHDASLE